MIIFNLVFIKKIIKLNFFLKKPKLVQTDRFRFGSGFLRQKPVQPGLARFFQFDSVFFCFFGLDSVWFGFFDFRLIKPKLNLTGRFFQNFNRFNRFFFTIRFFRLFFFSGFLCLIDFLVFFSPLILLRIIVILM